MQCLNSFPSSSECKKDIAAYLVGMGVADLRLIMIGGFEDKGRIR